MAKKERVVTEIEYNVALKQYRNSAVKIAEYQAKLKDAIAKANDKFKTLIEASETVKTAAYETVERYLKANKDNFFTDEKRSMETPFGTVGFRKGKHKVVLGEEVKVENVVERLRKLAWAKKYVVTKYDLDKTAIVKDKDDKKLVAKLNAEGIMIDQDDEVYIKEK